MGGPSKKEPVTFNKRHFSGLSEKGEEPDHARDLTPVEAVSGPPVLVFPS